MNAPNDNTAPQGLRGWWLTPPRPGTQRLIVPYEYRHLRGFGVTRIAGGSVAAAAGVICLADGVYAWAAFFPIRSAESRGLLVPHHRSLRTCPNLSLVSLRSVAARAVVES